MGLLLIAAMLPSAFFAAPAASPPREPGRTPFKMRVIDPYAAAPATCRTPMRQANGMRVEPRKLGELPPGDLHLTVVREVEGCPEPTVVRQGYGAVKERR